MTRFLIAGAVLTVVGMWADYASASDYAPTPVELCADGDERCLEAEAFHAAMAVVESAPEWCEVAYVEQDVTHGWRAVCILVSEGGAS